MEAGLFTASTRILIVAAKFRLAGVKIRVRLRYLPKEVTVI